MNLPTANNLPGAVGRGDGGDEGERGESSAAVLDILASMVLNVPREDMRYCPACLSWQRFVAEFEIGNGLFGHCANCGDERVVAFTHTVSEAA